MAPEFRGAWDGFNAPSLLKKVPKKDLLLRLSKLVDMPENRGARMISRWRGGPRECGRRRRRLLKEMSPCANKGRSGGNSRGERGGRGGGGMLPSMGGGEEEGGELAIPQVIPLKPKSSLGMALRRTIDEDGDSGEFKWTQDEQIKWLSREKDAIVAIRQTRVSAAAPRPPELSSDYLILRPPRCCFVLVVGVYSDTGTKLVSRKQVQEAQRFFTSSPYVTHPFPFLYYAALQKGKLVELSKAVIDLLYNMILKQFQSIGVEPIGAGELDGPFADLGPVNLIELTTGIHTIEALEMVKSHLMSILGPMMPKNNQGFYTSAVKMPKLQMSQVYMTSVMFGYFLRRVDHRYQVAKQLGILERTLRLSKSESRDLSKSLREIVNLMRMICCCCCRSCRASILWDVMKADENAAASSLEYTYYTEEDSVEDLNDPAAWTDPSEEEEDEFHYDEEAKKRDLELVSDGRTLEDLADPVSLRDYIEQFDSKTMVQCASLMSQESAVLLQEYQYALFGNIRGLQKEMALALGPPSSEGQPPTPEQIMEKIASAVEQDAVQTIILTFADQRRLILEAVAMGSFLRDAEDYVEKESTSDILTPLPPLPFDDNSIKGLLGDVRFTCTSSRRKPVAVRLRMYVLAKLNDTITRHLWIQDSGEKWASMSYISSNPFASLEAKPLKKKRNRKKKRKNKKEDATIADQTNKVILGKDVNTDVKETELPHKDGRGTTKKVLTSSFGNNLHSARVMQDLNPHEEDEFKRTQDRVLTLATSTAQSRAQKLSSYRKPAKRL
eukprot:jgi/Bigna1/85806/estExt_fgenesh1_pg.C_60166